MSRRGVLSSATALFVVYCLAFVAGCATREASPGAKAQIARTYPDSHPAAPGGPPPVEESTADAFPGARRGSLAGPKGSGRVSAEHAPSPAAPGLATRWGERRRSATYETDFIRDEPLQPWDIVEFFYDDEDGVRRNTGQGEASAYPGVVPVRGGALSVALVESDDDPLPLLVAQGRRYVIGDAGDRYSVLITNHTAGRFEVVASVDGLDVLSGGDASLDQRGYIVPPWGTLRIDGFRESANHVRAFRFGDIEESYALSRGRGRDIGVVGVALFTERGYNAMDGERPLPRPFPGRFAPPPGYE